jgi:hypothetical protein
MWQIRKAIECKPTHAAISTARACIRLAEAAKPDKKPASVENRMNIHRMECAKTPVLSRPGISIQLPYNAGTSLFQRVNTTVNH